jgi:DNA-directed RNA polymerase specialized sigma24 family protein
MGPISETMVRVEVLLQKYKPVVKPGYAAAWERKAYDRYPQWFQDCIVSRYKEGETIKELAMNLEMSSGSVNLILKRNGARTPKPRVRRARQ